MKSSYVLSILRSGLGVMTSRIFGLIRDIAIAGVYGASVATDIFFVAFAIPNLFRQFFAEGAIASAYMPFLSDKHHNGGQNAASGYLTQLMVVQALLMTGVIIVLVLLAPYVIKLFMPGFAGNIDNIALGATLLRIVMPYLFFVSLSGLLAGYLNLYGSYFIGYASTACLNIMMIIGAYIGYRYNGNIYSLALSVFAGGIFQLWLVYIYACCKGFRFGKLVPTDPDIKKTYQLVVPSLAGVGISQLNFLVGRIIASFLQPGSISWLFYANRLFQFPLGVFSVTISTVSLTELSIARTQGDYEKVNSLIDKAITALLLVIVPATIGLVGLSKELIDLIYTRNAFTETDALNSAIALQMYAAGLIFYSFASVFAKVYHSAKNTKTPVKIAGIAFLINLLLNLVLMRPLGHAGIALASSIAAAVNAMLLYKGIRGYSFSLRKNALLLAKILVSSYIMLFIMLKCKIYSVPVLLNVCICAVAYFISLYLMKIDIRRIFR